MQTAVKRNGKRAISLWVADCVPISACAFVQSFVSILARFSVFFCFNLSLFVCSVVLLVIKQTSFPLGPRRQCQITFHLGAPLIVQFSSRAQMTQTLVEVLLITAAVVILKLLFVDSKTTMPLALGPVLVI